MAAGMTQKGLADALDMSKASMSKMENGTRCVSMSQLEKIASVLGVKAADLLEGNRVGELTTGQRIKLARKKAGLTQAELAARLNIPYQELGQWELDHRNPKKENIAKIAAALGIDVSDLLGYTAEPKKEKLAIKNYAGRVDGTAFYTKATATITVAWPEDNVTCSNCSLCRYEHVWRSYRCGVTQEILPRPHQGIHDTCPFLPDLEKHAERSE
jgi:transcriptional regulator with XRE-family HTH domain